MKFSKAMGEASLLVGHNTNSYASTWSAYSNSVKAILGAGVLGIPFSLQYTGTILGIIIMVACCGLSEFSARLVLSAARAGRCKSYSEVAMAAFGPAGSAMVSIIATLYAIGTCVALLMAMQSSLVVLLPPLTWITPDALQSNNIYLVCITLSVILPLCLLPSIDSLRHTSMIALALTLYLLLAMYVRCPAVPEGLVEPWHMSPHVLLVPPVFLFAFNWHFQILPIGAELATRRSCRLVATAAHVTVLLFYIAVALVGYTLSFGDAVSNNILSNYPDDDLVINLARAGFGCSMICTFPLLFVPLRYSVHDLLVLLVNSVRPTRSTPRLRHQSDKRDTIAVAPEVVGVMVVSSDQPLTTYGTDSVVLMDSHRHAWHKWIVGAVESTVLVLGCLCIAVALPSMSIAFEFTGAIGASALMLVFPPLFYLRLSPTPWLSFKKPCAFGLVAVGVVSATLSTYEIVTTM